MQDRLQVLSQPPTLDYMPRAYDAPFDAGDDSTDAYHRSENPEDDNPGWLAHLQSEAELRERVNPPDPLDKDPDALADAPTRRHADKAGETSGEDDGDIPDHLPITEVGARSEDSSASTDSVIDESLRETLKAFGAWSFQRGLELVADGVYPGAGRLINLAFTIKEALGDAQALASPDSPRDLHVPLLHITGGLAVDLNVHLPGADESGDDTPSVSGFLSPDDGGLFGGWELDVDRQAEPAQGELSAEDDAILEAAEQVARQAMERRDRARRDEPPALLAIEHDLSLAARLVQDPRRRTDILRVTASHLRTRLYARPEFAAEPILVIYDPLAGLGMWLVNPALSEAAAGRCIVIRLKVTSGLMTVFIE